MSTIKKTTATKGKKQINKKTARPKSTTIMKRKPASTVKTGNKGRTIQVQFEGSGDLSMEVSRPNREPRFLDHLTVDQQDLVVMQEEFFDSNRISTASQTAEIIILDPEEAEEVGPPEMLQRILKRQDQLEKLVREVLSEVRQQERFQQTIQRSLDLHIPSPISPLSSSVSSPLSFSSNASSPSSPLDIFNSDAQTSLSKAPTVTSDLNQLNCNTSSDTLAPSDPQGSVAPVLSNSERTTTNQALNLLEPPVLQVPSPTGTAKSCNISVGPVSTMNTQQSSQFQEFTTFQQVLTATDPDQPAPIDYLDDNFDSILNGLLTDMRTPQSTTKSTEDKNSQPSTPLTRDRTSCQMEVSTYSSNIQTANNSHHTSAAVKDDTHYSIFRPVTTGNIDFLVSSPITPDNTNIQTAPSWTPNNQMYALDPPVSSLQTSTPLTTINTDNHIYTPVSTMFSLLTSPPATTVSKCNQIHTITDLQTSPPMSTVITNHQMYTPAPTVSSLHTSPSLTTLSTNNQIPTIANLQTSPPRTTINTNNNIYTPVSTLFSLLTSPPMTTVSTNHQMYTPVPSGSSLHASPPLTTLSTGIQIPAITDLQTSHPVTTVITTNQMCPPISSYSSLLTPPPVTTVNMSMNNQICTAAPTVSSLLTSPPLTPFSSNNQICTPVPAISSLRTSPPVTTVNTTLHTSRQTMPSTTDSPNNQTSTPSTASNINNPTTNTGNTTNTNSQTSNPSTTVSTNNQTSSPETTSSTHNQTSLVIPSRLPTLCRRTSGDLIEIECDEGSRMMEIDGADNIPLGKYHFFVKSTILDSLKAESKTSGMFLWKLTKTIFKERELIDKNFFGGKGKSPLSPRRRHSIMHAFVDAYQTRSKKTFHKAVKSVNNGLYNLNNQN